MKCLGALFLALGSVLLQGASCGEPCPPRAPVPLPMTENRAREIDPGVMTGLAVSTTYVHGDCRPPKDLRDGEVSGDSAKAVDCVATVNAACAQERAPLRVLVTPVNVSLRRTEDCPERYLAAEIAAHAVVDLVASPEGELVVRLPSGTYAVFVSRDGRCAACGLPGGEETCVVDVTERRVVARDLVLDQAMH